MRMHCCAAGSTSSSSLITSYVNLASTLSGHVSTKLPTSSQRLSTKGLQSAMPNGRWSAQLATLASKSNSCRNHLPIYPARVCDGARSTHCSASCQNSMIQIMDCRMGRSTLVMVTFYFVNVPRMRSFPVVMKLLPSHSFSALDTCYHISRSGPDCAYQMARLPALLGERHFGLQSKSTSHGMSK